MAAQAKKVRVLMVLDLEQLVRSQEHWELDIACTTEDVIAR